MNWESHFRQMRRVEFGSDSDSDFGGVMHAQDLIATNDYFHNAKPKTTQAAQLVSEWSRWWATTGDPDNYFFLIPDAVWDEARNRRNAFNRANATTPEEKKVVEQVIKTGVTTEAARGEPERRDPTTGDFFVPPKPVLPPWVFPAVAVGAGAVVGTMLLKKILFPL